MSIFHKYVFEIYDITYILYTEQYANLQYNLTEEIETRGK